MTQRGLLWSGLGVVVGLLAGYFLWAQSTLDHEQLHQCLGDPIRVSPSPGFTSNSLTLFVTAHPNYGLVTVRLDGLVHQEAVLDPDSASVRATYSYVGPWSGPATLTVTAPQPKCLVDIFYRFASVPNLR